MLSYAGMIQVRFKGRQYDNCPLSQIALAPLAFYEVFPKKEIRPAAVFVRRAKEFLEIAYLLMLNCSIICGERQMSYGQAFRLVLQCKSVFGRIEAQLQ